jgi:hypothetical protein
MKHTAVDYFPLKPVTLHTGKNRRLGCANKERKFYLKKKKNRKNRRLRKVMKTSNGIVFLKKKRNLNCLFTSIYLTTLFVTQTLRAAII